MHAPRSLYLPFVLLSLLLAGCASNVGSNVKVSQENLAKYDSLTVEETVSAFEQRVNQAAVDGMAMLAPHYYTESVALLKDIQTQLAKKQRKTEVINQVGKGDALLDKGQRIMVLVRKVLARELELKGLLDRFNAGTVYPKEYKAVMSDLADLIEKIELDKTEKIDKDKAELIKAMEALDLKAVQYAALHEADAINKDTKDKGGEKQAPATYAESLRVYQDALQRIAAAPHDEPAVKKAADEAMFAALHARHVTERVSSLQKQFKTSVEAVALEEENRLHAIATALGHIDLRNQSIDKQAQAIESAAVQLAATKDAKQKAEYQLGSANDQIKDLEKREKEANAALQQSATQVQTKDAEIRTLSTRIILLEAENKNLGEQLAAKQVEAAPAVEPVAPQAETTPQPHADAAQQPQLEAEPQPQVESTPQPQVESSPQPQAEAEPQPQAEPTPQTTVAETPADSPPPAEAATTPAAPSSN